MNLIDILVDRLPVLGGWPIDSDDERTLTSSLPEVSWGMNGGGYYAFRGPNDSVNYQQYENAILASRNEWDGEGLPPVGLVCEGQFPRHPGISFEWQECLVLYVFERECAVKSKGTSTLHYCDDFRPIRSEADKKREIGVLSLARSDPTVGRFEYGQKMSDGKLLGYAWYELYDKIAAGEVAGIRID